MRILRSMASIVNRQQIDIAWHKNDKADQLLQYLMGKTAYEEEDLIEKLYDNNKHGRKYYHQLKRNLRDRVINTFFSMNPDKKGYWDTYFDVGKKNLACILLWNKGKPQAASTIAKDALRVALKYQCTPYSYSLSRLLADHFAAIDPNPVKYRDHKAISEECKEHLHWEQKAKGYYHDLALQLRISKSIGEDLIQQARSYVKELQQAPAEMSWEFEFTKLNVDLFLRKMTNDIPGIIEACQGTKIYFDSLPFNLPNRPNRSIGFNLIPAYIHAGDYEAAQDTINQTKTLLSRSGRNFISVLQYEVILGFHLHDLQLVAQAIQELKKSKLSSRIREELRIYETYLAFLSDQAVRMSTFLNDTPKFSMDKKGMNINRVALQILILLQKNDRAGIIDRVEALEMYAYRHLKKDPTTRRSQIFMRLLFLSVRHSFDWGVIEKQTAKTFAELKQTPRHLSTIDIEVVPYEVLWGKVRELLM